MSIADVLQASLQLERATIDSAPLFCDAFYGMSYMERKSASDSVMLKARLVSNRRRVFLKIMPLPASALVENSGAIEASVYLQTTNQMEEDRITPHVVPCVGYFVSYKVTAGFKLGRYTTPEDGQSALKAWQALQYVSEIPTGLDAACVLVLEDEVTGNTMYNILKTPPLKGFTHPGFRSILFQLVYTLEAFSQFSPPLRHNDLHMNNVWVNEVPNGVITYVLDEKTAYQVPTNGYFVRAFDFDWAYNGKMDNTKLDATTDYDDTSFCEDDGKCNAVNTEFDTHYILSYLYDWTKRANADLIFPGEFRANQTYNDPNYKMCHKADPDADECEGEIEPDELRQLHLPRRRGMLKELGAGFKVPLSAVDVNSPMTFFVSEQLREKLTEHKYNTRKRALPTSYVPKRAQIMRPTCPQSSVYWPTRLLKGGPNTATEADLQAIIVWLLEQYELAAPPPATNGKMVYLLEHFMRYCMINALDKSVLQLYASAFFIVILPGAGDNEHEDIAHFTDDDEDVTEPELVAAIGTVRAYMEAAQKSFATAYELLFICGPPPADRRQALQNLQDMAVDFTTYFKRPEARAALATDPGFRSSLQPARGTAVYNFIHSARFREFDEPAFLRVFGQ